MQGITNQKGKVFFGGGGRLKKTLLLKLKLSGKEKKLHCMMKWTRWKRQWYFTYRYANTLILCLSYEMYHYKQTWLDMQYTLPWHAVQQEDHQSSGLALSTREETSSTQSCFVQHHYTNLSMELNFTSNRKMLLGKIPNCNRFYQYQISSKMPAHPIPTH